MAEMTVASTTDTQKDIDQAAGVVHKPETSTDEEVRSASTDGQVAEPEAVAEPTEHEPKAKSGFQKRIDKLTRDKYERDQQIQSLTARLEKLEKTTKAEPEAVDSTVQSEPKGATKPTPKDTNADGSAKYASYEEFVEALADWKSDQKIQERISKLEEEERQQEEQAARQKELDTFNDRMNEARERYDDFDEVVGRPGVQIPEAVKLACINLENGPDVAYYLGQHPDVCKKLCAMTPIAAVTETGAISAALRPVESQETSSGPAARRPSSAPAPIRPIGGSSTKSSVPIDDLPYQEYKKLRNQQIKNRYR